MRSRCNTTSSANGFRQVRVSVGERLLWGDTVGEGPAPVRFGLTLPPGATTLVFSCDKPGEKIGTDPRPLAFQIANLEIVVQRREPSK